MGCNQLQGCQLRAWEQSRISDPTPDLVSEILHYNQIPGGPRGSWEALLSSQATTHNREGKCVPQGITESEINEVPSEWLDGGPGILEKEAGVESWDGLANLPKEGKWREYLRFKSITT